MELTEEFIGLCTMLPQRETLEKIVFCKGVDRPFAQGENLASR